GNARFADTCTVERYAERRAHGRNVLVKAFGQFISTELAPRLGQGDADRLDKFVRTQVLLLVVQIESVERQYTFAHRATQHHAATERNHPRHRVADRRAVGDVAAKGAGIADREGSKTLPHLGQLRVV